jgi:hypothetical protein
MPIVLPAPGAGGPASFLMSGLGLQLFDFIFKRQLSSLEGRDLEIVGRGMGQGFIDLTFYVAVPSLQFLKMGSESHDYSPVPVSSSA